MSIEKSAGVIIFKKEPFDAAQGKKDKIFYLLLHYPRNSSASKNYWDLPKGHIKKGEKTEDTAKREAEEETGLKDIRILEGFKETIKYFFKFEGKNILKFVTFYLAETKINDVRISDEHIGYQWLPYEEALGQLKFENAKKIIKKAHLYLIKRNV